MKEISPQSSQRAPREKIEKNASGKMFLKNADYRDFSLRPLR